MNSWLPLHSNCVTCTNSKGSEAIYIDTIVFAIFWAVTRSTLWKALRDQPNDAWKPSVKKWNHLWEGLPPFLPYWKYKNTEIYSTQQKPWNDTIFLCATQFWIKTTLSGFYPFFGPLFSGLSCNYKPEFSFSSNAINHKWGKNCFYVNLINPNYMGYLHDC